MPDWGLYNTILLVAVFLCWVVSGLFAFPAFVILRRRGQVNFWTSLGSGAAVGGILALLFYATFLLGQPVANQSNQIETIPQAALFGGSIGFFFWLIGVWRNPAFMKQSDLHPEDIFT